jgi:hypothetical protein
MAMNEVEKAKPRKGKYTITGKIDMGEIKEPCKEFQLRVYAVRDGKVLGTGVPRRDGSFSIEFVHPSEARIGVNVIVAPDVPEKYHQNIVTKDACIETLERPLSALDWKEGNSFRFDMHAIQILPCLYEHWIRWMRPFHVHGRVRCRNGGKGIAYALVEAFEVDQLAGGGFAQDLIGSDVANKCGNFHITFPWFLVLLPQGRPDLVFRVSQNVDGEVKVIYSEDPSQTRWNMVDNSFVYLWVEEECLTFDEPDAGRPGDCTFLFTRVGLIGVDRIDSNGYAESSHLTPAGNQDAPFGRRLHLCGWFGESTDLTHYRIQYSKNGGPFKDMTDPLSNKYYAGGGKWATVSTGPFTLAGQANLFTTPYLLDKAEGLNRPWWFPDLLARWDTTKADGDGLYTIRILGYKWDGTVLSSASCLVIDAWFGQIKLQIDNTPPESEILSMIHLATLPPPSMPGLLPHVVQPCDIIEFRVGDSLVVHFKAHDPNGHLGGYKLHAMYGHNCYVTPAPPGASDQYHADPSQQWHGGNFSTSYKASDYGAANGSCQAGNMPTCAYQFRLVVWKRTTNGYGLIYPWVEDTTHVTIKRV